MFSAHSAMFAFTMTTHLNEFLERMLSIVPGLASKEVCLFDISECGKRMRSRLLGSFTASNELSTRNECICLIEQYEDRYKIYPVKTALFFYGFIAVEVQNEEEFSDYDSILSNYAITVSIILENKQQKNDLEWINRSLEDRIKQRTESLDQANQHLESILTKVIQALAITVECRDPYTAGHQYRVAVLARAIAHKFNLEQAEIHKIYLGGLIHDIGKIQVPIEILTFPGVLTQLQIDYIKIHPESGRKIISPIGFDETIVDIVHHHHERIDGSGYPDGLKNDDILLGTRIVAVADVFEAMTSHRPYRPKRSKEETLDELRAGAGQIYDQQVVDFCIQLNEKEKFVLPTYQNAVINLKE